MGLVSEICSLGLSYSLSTSSRSSSASSSSGSTSASGTTSSSSSSLTISGSSLLSLGHLLELKSVLHEGRFDELGLGPEIRGKESVGLLESLEDGSDEVLSGSGLTSAAGINIIDTSELEDLLGNLSGNATSSSRSGNKSDSARTALTLYLNGNGMDSSDSGSPISSSDGEDVELGVNKSTLDGNLDLLGDLDSNTNVTLSVSDSDDDLESGSLTGLGLLLDGENAHNLIRKLGLNVGEESIGDRGLLDGDGVGVDLFELVDLSVLNESSELGDGSPLVLSSSHSSSSGTTSSSTSATSSSLSESSASGSSSSSGSGSLSGGGLLLWGFHFNDSVFLGNYNDNN